MDHIEYRIALVTAAATIAPHRPSIAVQDLIAFLHTGVEAVMNPQPAEEPKPSLVPVVSARKSVTADAVTCMCCGFVGKSLKRHLRTAHGFTPEAYREEFGLPDTHPIVAPNYSATRSNLAKENGLGRKG